MNDAKDERLAFAKEQAASGIAILTVILCAGAVLGVNWGLTRLGFDTDSPRDMTIGTVGIVAAVVVVFWLRHKARRLLGIK